MNNKIIFLVALGILLFSKAKSQGEDYTYTKYTKEDGLPSNTVYGVTSDKDGFVWFCTDVGVAKFDGTHFKIFTIADGLPSNEVFKLFCDSKNRIWLTTMKAEVAYIKNDKVFTKENDKTIQQLKIASSNFEYFEDSKGSLYFENGVNAIQIVNSVNEIKTLVIDLKFSNVTNIKYLEKADTLYLISQYFSLILNNDSLRCLNYSVLNEYDKNVTGFFNKLDGQQSDFISSHGACLLGTNLYSYKLNLKTFKSKSLKDNILKLRSHSLSWNIPFVDSNFWILEKDKIRIVDPNSLKEKIIFSGHSFSFIHQDKSNRIWLSSQKTGVLLLKKQVVNTVLSNIISHAIYVDKNAVYLGIQNDRVKVLDKRSYQECYEHNLKSLATDFGIIKIIAMNGGLLVANSLGVHKSTALLKPIFKNLGISIKNIYRSTDTLIIENQIGLVKISLKNNNTIDSLYFPKRLYSYTNYNNLEIIGSQDSLYYLENKKFKPYPLDIPFDYRALDFIVKDSILIATTAEKGIFFINKHKVVKNLHAKNGLSTNTVYKSLLNNEVLYTASNKGIQVYDFKTDSVAHVFESDGLASNVVYDIAIDHDTLYAATENGLSIIPISNIKKQRTFPLFIKPIYKTTDTIWTIPKIIESHSDTAITIVLNALSFDTKGDVRYYYRIRELDSTFHSSLDQNIVLKLVQHGFYTFEAYSENAEGTRSNRIVHAIYIKPYFYQTLGFKILSAVGFLLSLFFTVRYVTKRAKSKQKQKTELETKIRNLEISAWKSAINPHFLFNSLNTMQGLFHMNDFAKANSYVTEFSSILRKTIDQSGRLLIKVEDEIAYLKNYLELEKLKRVNKFDYELEVQHKTILPYFIPSLLIQPILENSIKHAIQDNENGFIEVKFAMNGKLIVCTISDNGKGFSTEVIAQNYKSKGLELIRNKIAIVEKLTNQHIDFKYDNKRNENQKITGAVTIFTFPLITFDYDDTISNN